MAIRLAVKWYACAPIGYCTTGGISVFMSQGTLRPPEVRTSGLECHSCQFHRYDRHPPAWVDRNPSTGGFTKERCSLHDHELAPPWAKTSQMHVDPDHREYCVQRVCNVDYAAGSHKTGTDRSSPRQSEVLCALQHQPDCGTARLIGRGRRVACRAGLAAAGAVNPTCPRRQPWAR